MSPNPSVSYFITKFIKRQTKELISTVFKNGFARNVSGNSKRVLFTFKISFRKKLFVTNNALLLYLLTDDNNVKKERKCRVSPYLRERNRKGRFVCAVSLKDTRDCEKVFKP